MSKALPWSASLLVALALSCAALTLFSMLYAGYDLQRKLGLDDDVCWLALLVGPACLPLIHRRLHSTRWAPRTCLVTGALTSAGCLLWFAELGAEASAVAARGASSGFGSALGRLVALWGVLIGVTAVLGAGLALAVQARSKRQPD